MSADDLNAQIVKAYALRARELSEKTTAAFALSLGVGNGGALVLLGGRVLQEASESLTALAVPSCWLFAVGLLVAGALNPIAGWRAGLEANLFEKQLMNLVDPRLPRPVHPKRKLDRLFWFEVAMEWISAACFAGGLIYPLAVLCVRYLTSGHGFFPPA